jgi:hypothetical protein
MLTLGTIKTVSKTKLKTIQTLFVVIFKFIFYATKVGRAFYEAKFVVQSHYWVLTNIYDICPITFEVNTY